MKFPKRKSTKIREHKDYFKRMGIERFYFDEKEEFLKYKYLCGEKIGKYTWYTKCRNTFMPYSYKQWKQDIIEKYGKYSKEQLIEFMKYLNLGVLRGNMRNVLDNIIYAALASAFLAVIFSDIVVSVAKEGVNVTDVFLTFIFIVFAVSIIVYVIDCSIRKKILKQAMYKDYKDIIESII